MGGRKGMTIAAAPMVALTSDLLLLFREKGVAVGKWEDRSVFPSALLAPIEQVGRSGLKSFCDDMAAQGRLSAIFIEKAHLRISWAAFRPQMDATS